MTELILREKGLVVNRREFKAEMEAQKERSRSASSVDTDDWIELIDDDVQEFVGYDYTEVEVKITAIGSSYQEQDLLSPGIQYYSFLWRRRRTGRVIAEY